VREECKSLSFSNAELFFSTLSSSQAVSPNHCLQKGSANMWLMPTCASDYLFLLLPLHCKLWLVCSSERADRGSKGLFSGAADYLQLALTVTNKQFF